MNGTVAPLPGTEKGDGDVAADADVPGKATTLPRAISAPATTTAAPDLLMRILSACETREMRRGR
ncbi:hypothetical protein GCM10010116_29580 [Microbispora rosea subsp. aerata]|nr:hypothetical protein GCM10010116_29580 [Microbispora rosea subsp. aerata]GIH55572.1 hypothetical protein Mro02_24860 [Microbispora rosea subsp. aerata]GLJ86516.1 hypothetical protein GCM10017588_52540 [Microbispora rosea subsp. aerata]